MTALSDRLPAVLRSRRGTLLLVAALQLMALGYMVFDRVRLVKTGKEIVLPIIPVDPRDLFKGDYVRLAYPISRPDAVAFSGPMPDRSAWGYAVVEPDPDPARIWKIVRISASRPTDLSPGQIVMKARAPGGWREKQPVLHFGLERYYVPEGTGLALEKMAADRKLAAIVAVDASGNAAIKGLSVDGRKVYDEPMF